MADAQTKRATRVARTWLFVVGVALLGGGARRLRRQRDREPAARMRSSRSGHAPRRRRTSLTGLVALVIGATRARPRPRPRRTIAFGGVYLVLFAATVVSPDLSGILATPVNTGGPRAARSSSPPAASSPGSRRPGSSAASLTARRSPARTPGTLPVCRSAARPHPGNDLNELSGEEWLYFTKSVWTTAYPSELGHAAAQGPRREQAAPADGPADRVLHPVRRARARPVRRRRRDAARRGDRARAAAGDRARARPALGRRLPRDRRRALRAERDGARAAARRPRPERPRRRPLVRPVGARAAAGRRARAAAGDPGRAPSTSSPPTRRTTSSCR